jgi:predicted DNA-binding ribbon-helix-helix protein
MQLFEHIEELAEDPECFVAVLIDEIESLAASRSRQGAQEPGDATR